MEPERLWAPPILEEQRSASVPTREMAQAYLDRLYEDLEMRAVRRSSSEP